MDDYGDVKEAHKMLLEKLLLDAGIPLPGIYDGIYDKKAQKAHYERIRTHRKESA